MNMLGDTLGAIAFEKAGIIKPNVGVLIGEHGVETDHVFDQKALSTNSPIHFADEIVDCTRFSMLEGAISASFLYKQDATIQIDVATDFGGEYQKKNLSTAIAALLLLRHQIPQLSIATISKGLSNLSSLTKFMGRWMLIKQAPKVIFDSAHNEAGLREVLHQLQQINFKRLHWVYGTVKDKDISTNLSLLPKDASYYFASPDIPRGLDASVLKEQANNVGLQGEAFKSVHAAYENAQSKAENEDLILVCGSIFVVAELI
jgi:dihydrofolate synthase/folylpolyglutamate synthase